MIRVSLNREALHLGDVGVAMWAILVSGRSPKGGQTLLYNI